MRRMGAGLFLAIMFLCSGRDAGAEPLNLYEWVAVGPNVVVAEVLGQEFRYVLVRVERTLRGDIPPGAEILVDQKGANRARTSSQNALRFLHHGRYMILLEPPDRRKAGKPIFHAITRGPEGAREMPGEGDAALIAAVESFVKIQDMKNDGATWRFLGDYLESSNNPMVLDTALQMFVKFRRGSYELLPVLDPLFDHPRSSIRSGCARLAGQILALPPPDSMKEPHDIFPVLLSRARTDRSPDVRVAATAAIGVLEGEEIDSILREIADRDEEQAVRYEAEKLLFLRKETEDDN